MSRRIVVEFLGDDKSLSKTANDVEGKTSRLSGTLAKVGKAAALGLGAGAVVAGKALWEMGKNAMEDEAAQRKLAIGLKNATGATDSQIAAVEKWIEAQGRATGITDDEMRPALQRLVESTGSVSEAQRQMQIAMDVSAGTGKSLKTVTEAMMKANNGSVAGLSRLGLKTKDARGETISFETALRKMSDTFGGQAAAKANTLEGKMDRLRLIFDETKETIGAKLLPVAERFANWMLTKGIPGATRLTEKVAAGVRWFREHSTEIGVAAAALAALTLVTKAHTTVLAIGAAGGLAKWAAGLAIVTKVSKVATAVQWAFNAALAANPIGIAIVAIAALAAGLVYAYKKSATFRAVVGKALDGVEAGFEAIGDAGRWLWNKVLQPVFKFIVDAVGKVLTWFGKLLQLIGKAPGMEWVGRLGDKLVNAGRDAQGLAAKIRDIPDRHTTTVRIDTAVARRAVSDFSAWMSDALNLGGRGSARMRVGSNAAGTPSWRGGLTWVGEQGPELMRLPAGTRIWSNPQSRAMAGSGGGDVINFYISGALDPDGVGKRIEQILARRRRTTGQRLAFQTGTP